MNRKFFLFTSLLIVLILFWHYSPALAVNPKVIIETSKGNITLELFADKAPITVKNFLSYVDDHFYDGTIFHRVIKGFMIQGGGLTADFHSKPTPPPIKNEDSNV